MGSISKKQIIAYLDSKGFKHAQLGFDYMIKAIELSILDKSYIIGGVTKRLYPTVAKEFDTTDARAERAMRHSIETADYFKGLKKLSNSEFIARAVDDLIYGGDK